jgi:hypothetical protein
MKRQILFVAALSVFGLASASAQGGTNQCTSSPVPAQDACQQAYDIYQFMAPQLGLALAGGNATLGQGSTLGGFGHFSIGLRANGFQGRLFAGTGSCQGRSLDAPADDSLGGVFSFQAGQVVSHERDIEPARSHR